MLSSAYKRSKSRVDAAYKKVGTSLVALEPLRIQIPERFTERGLATIEDVTYILGFMAIITQDNYYSSSTVTAMLRVEPDRIGRCVVNDVAYIELHFDKGSKLIASTDVVMVDNMIHRVYTEMYGKGRIPWYYEYEDVPKMFQDVGKYNGVTVGADLAIWEYVAASLCRDPDDPTKYFRQRKDIKGHPEIHPYIVPLRNVSYGATNLVARLGGSYFDQGMTGTLTNPADRNERLESMLRQ